MLLAKFFRLNDQRLLRIISSAPVKFSELRPESRLAMRISVSRANAFEFFKERLLLHHLSPQLNSHALQFSDHFRAHQDGGHVGLRPSRRRSLIPHASDPRWFGLL